jgi:hypothetical protein
MPPAPRIVEVYLVVIYTRVSMPGDEPEFIHHDIRRWLLDPGVM